MLEVFTEKMWSFNMLFLNWPRPVQYQNEAIHGGSQTLFYMENFIGQHLLLARCPFFHFGTEQRRLLEKKKTPCMS